MENLTKKTTGVLSTAFDEDLPECVSAKTGVIQARGDIVDIVDKAVALVDDLKTLISSAATKQ